MMLDRLICLLPCHGWTKPRRGSKKQEKEEKKGKKASQNSNFFFLLPMHDSHLNPNPKKKILKKERVCAILF